MRAIPDPVALLNAWLAVEALQPQTFASQERLISDEPPRKRRGDVIKLPARAWFPFDVAAGEMPWERPEGDREALKLAEDEVIRWYLPLGFADMKSAVALLVKDVEPDGPERERASGVAVLALAAFDERGFAAPSKLLLSSFGWSCGRVLAGRIGELHQFMDVQQDLCREIGEALVERAADGSRIPTSKHGFVQGMTALRDVLELPPAILERPRVAIRVIGETETGPVDIINSFFLRDLHRVRRLPPAERDGAALTAYLATGTQANRQDVLADKAVLEALVAPARFPLARWPAPKPSKLVTLQQAAVNAAMSDLADGGLLSINGPPGTGKTTLLRDVLAAVICERADALLEFDEPEAAFSPVEVVAESGRRQTLYKLDPRLRGRGVVVASSNNAAVRNVSAELPLLGNVAADFDVRYFAGTADTVHGAEGACWGLIAAVLGNKANRFEFVEDAWWDADWGLEKYLGAVTGRLGRQRDAAAPKIIDAEQPPLTLGEAGERWRRASLDYREKRSVVLRMRALREQIRTALLTSAGARQAAENAAIANAEAVRNADQAEATRQAAQTALARASAAVADTGRLVDGGRDLRPGLLPRLFGRDAAWRAGQARALDLLRQAITDRDVTGRELAQAGERGAAAREQAEAATAALHAAQQQLSLLSELEAERRGLHGGAHAGPAFWGSGHADIHTSSPWADAEFTAARDALFASAIHLHRAFIDAGAWPMKLNLGLMMDHLKGKRTPSGADLHLGDLWDSLFLLTPLVSTTFASFDRLMDGLEAQEIGWLIVDEAGQAAPQMAVGAIWRSRRALIIGDPLQVEPISTLPEGLTRAIFTSHGAHPDLWAAPRASVQTLCDAASPLMTRLGAGGDARDIGMPLLVHRRCQNPMFSISNEIAYGGLMVHAAGDPASPIASALSPWAPGSCWIDVVSEAEKWSQAEGMAVVDLLQRLADRDIRQPSLYIISPFRDVADRLRGLVVKSGVLGSLGIPAKQQKRWSETSIGTVHTFQGKEAEAVFLVLGASAAASRGSRNWVAGTPNLLNVAATRAKKALYIVGSHAAWASAGVFATPAIQQLPVVSWPFDKDGDGQGGSGAGSKGDMS